MLGMGSPCLRSLVCWSRNSLVLSSRQIHQSSRLSESYPVIPMELSHGSSQLIRCSRTSFDDYQDFQGYAKPLRLLPASKPHIFTKSPLEDMSSYFGVDGSEPTYTVKLRTSSIFGSCLSSMDAGILLCLIDENGDSILQRLPVSIPLDDPQIKEAAFPDPLPFQRDSVDIFTFGGHKLGKLKALWVGLESGRWRLGGVSVTFLRKDPSDHSDEEEPCNNGLQYEFEDEDIQLGEGGGLSMVELRPSHITQLASLDLFTLLSSASISQSNSVLNREIFNEESIKEYADLKTSLLFYDVMLIFAGTLIASVSSGEESGLAFLTGGVVGFLYLLMLQRSVDVLPAPESISMKGKSGNLEELFGPETVKGSILGIAFALVFAILAVKYGSGVTLVALKPQQILVGMTGFLVCKIAVVLAAFKPMPVRLEDRE